MKRTLKFSVAAAAAITFVVPNLALGDDYTIKLNNGNTWYYNNTYGTDDPYSFFNTIRENDNTVTIDEPTNGNMGDVGSYGLQMMSANNNRIIIRNGVLDNVYGGNSDYGEAINNTVTYAGGSVNGLFGGFVLDKTTAQNSGMSADEKTGNTLNIGESQTKPATMNTLETAVVSNFETINFYLPSSVANGDIALKFVPRRQTTPTGAVIVNRTPDPVNLGGVTIKAFLSGANGLDKNSIIHLINNSAGIEDTDAATGATMTTDASGVTNINIAGLINVKGNIALDASKQNLDLTFNGDPDNGASANPNSKLLLETNLAHITMVNEGANLFLSHLEHIIPDDTNTKYFPFAFANGLDKRLKTGSHIDLKGFNVMAGVGTNDYMNSGVLTSGLFLEYGKGKYENELDNKVTSEGKTQYLGGGTFAKYNTTNNYYVEGSLRVGQVKTESEKGIYDEYKLTSTYYGAHFGLGKMFELASSNDLDIFTRFIYAYTQGNDTQIQGVDTNFDNITSKRAQVGFIDNIKFSDTSKIYAGATYQYEFDGDSEGTVSAVGQSASIASPTLKGSTGIGELGYVYESGSIKFDVGVKGYVGKERGYSGNVGVVFKF